MIYVGIDWSRDKHDIHVLGEDGENLARFSIPHLSEGFQALADRISAIQHEPHDVLVGIEKNAGPLVDFLAAQDYKVYPINPLSSNRARGRYRPSGCKDDASDAFVLADMVRTDRGWLRPLQSVSNEAMAMRPWIVSRRDIVKRKTALTLQLRALLAEWCPDVNRLLGDFKCKWHLQLVTVFPLHKDLVGAHGNKFNAFLKANRMGAEKKKEIVAARAKTPIQIPDDKVEHLRWRIRFIVSQISNLRENIAQIEGKLEKLMEKHINNEIFESLPATGTITRATLTAWFDNCGFSDANDLAAQFGIAPITVQSGKSKSVRRRRATDNCINQAMLYFAFNTAKTKTCWARDYYKRKTGAGMKRFTALRCLAKRWVRIITAMVKNGEKYDEQKHRANIKKREKAVA